MVETDDARISDETLIGRTAAGDAASFGRLVRRHQAAVYRFALACAPGETEEILHETFHTARASARRHQDEPSALPWLLAIARQAIDRRQPARKETDTAPLRDLARNAGWGAPVRLSTVSRISGVETALAALPSEDQEILTLCDREYFTIEEAARVIGASEAAARSRLHRARLRLTARLREIVHGA